MWYNACHIRKKYSQILLYSKVITVYFSFQTLKIPLIGEPITGLTKSPHFHPHLEMIYLLDGSTVTSLDGQELPMEAGDLFLSFPNQIHCYYDRTQIKGYMVIFEPDTIPDLLKLFEKQFPASPVIKKEFLPEDIDIQLASIVNKIQSQDPLRTLSAKGELFMIMADILPLMHFVDIPIQQNSVKEVLLYCLENFREPLTLDKLASALHLNKYYISHIFKKRLKISFPDFINSLRVESACKLLSEECSITEVAFASGFSSIRTFNRAFVQHIGRSPSEYIRTQLNKD